MPIVLVAMYTLCESYSGIMALHPNPSEPEIRPFYETCWEEPA